MKRLKCIKEFNIDRIIILKGNMYMYNEEKNMLKLTFNLGVILTKKELEHFKELK